MRVALVLAGPYPAPRGSQVLVQQLADGLAARGHAVHLVTYGPGPTGPPGPRVARLLRDAVLLPRLWRVVRRAGIDVIHAHNYEAAIAALLVGRVTGRPVVYHGHNALAEELPMYFGSAAARWVAGAFGRLVDGQVPRRADFCIAVTAELARILRARGVAEGGLACIEPARHPIDVRPVTGRGEPSGLVCYAGNLDGYQNLDFLLRSFARVRACVPDARLVVVTHAGAGASAAALAIPGVEVVHAQSFEEVRGRLLAADVAVSPRAEASGFPMKLLNYMTAGKAIVACVGSAKGIVDGVTGRVVPDGDEEAFAAAIVALLCDGTERERLGAAARRAVDDPAAWEGVLDRIEAIYMSVSTRVSAQRARQGSTQGSTQVSRQVPTRGSRGAAVRAGARGATERRAVRGAPAAE